MITRPPTLSQLGQVFPLQQVVGLQEDFSQSGTTGGIVSVVEPIKSVELLVRVHVQRVDRQVVSREFERIKHLL